MLGVLETRGAWEGGSSLRSVMKRMAEQFLCSPPTRRVTLEALWFVMGPWLGWCLGDRSPAPDPGALPSTLAYATTWTGSGRLWRTTKPCFLGQLRKEAGRPAEDYGVPTSAVSTLGLSCPEAASGSLPPRTSPAQQNSVTWRLCGGMDSHRGAPPLGTTANEIFPFWTPPRVAPPLRRDPGPVTSG